jgi:hypothetical protein
VFAGNCTHSKLFYSKNPPRGRPAATVATSNTDATQQSIVSRPERPLIGRQQAPPQPATQRREIGLDDVNHRLPQGRGFDSSYYGQTVQSQELGFHRNNTTTELPTSNESSPVMPDQTRLESYTIKLFPCNLLVENQLLITQLSPYLTSVGIHSLFLSA